jgi:hypothetical protein
MVKISPGVSLEEIPAGTEVAFVAEGIRLKEAQLRFGDLQNGHDRSAIVLPGPHELYRGEPAGATATGEPLAILYEPNPAVLRAGLVRTLGAEIGARQLDASIAYLTSDRHQSTPFARAWPVERHGPFGLKTLNRWLRQDGVGRVIVKKRGAPIDPDSFRKRLKTVPGGPEKTVFVTRVEGRPWMVLCRYPINEVEALG